MPHPGGSDLSGPSLTIAFAVEGEPVRLNSAGQWRAAIDRGDLKRDTRVLVEEGGQPTYTGPAAGHEALAAFFSPEAPPPKEPDPEAIDPPSYPDASSPAKSASTSTSAKIDPPAPAPLRTKPVAEPATLKSAASPPEPPPAPPEPLTPPRKPKDKTMGCFLLLAGLVIVVFLISRCGGSFGGAVETRYIERETGLFAEPGGPAVGTAPRGEAITVHIPRDQQPSQIRIEGGRFDGRYLAADAVSPTPRPTLRATGLTKRVRGLGVRVRREPGGQVFEAVNTGDTVYEIGVTPDGWSEIQYGEGVAYVATEFTGRRGR